MADGATQVLGQKLAQLCGREVPPARCSVVQWIQVEGSFRAAHQKPLDGEQALMCSNPLQGFFTEISFHKMSVDESPE